MVWSLEPEESARPSNSAEKRPRLILNTLCVVVLLVVPRPALSPTIGCYSSVSQAMGARLAERAVERAGDDPLRGCTRAAHLCPRNHEPRACS